MFGRCVFGYCVVMEELRSRTLSRVIAFGRSVLGVVWLWTSRFPGYLSRVIVFGRSVLVFGSS